MRQSYHLYCCLKKELEARWDAYYEAAVAAAAKEGNSAAALSLRHRGRSAAGPLAGNAARCAGQKPGRLDADRIAKLDKLGIEWKQRSELAWERAFAAAKKYRDDHGDLLVPVRYHDRSGFALGEWIVYNRQRYISGNLTRARIERLEAIGMVWNASTDLWEQSYAAAARYYLEHKDLEAPIKYVTPDGFALGVWLSSQRSAYKNGGSDGRTDRAAGGHRDQLGQPECPQMAGKFRGRQENTKETYGNLESPSNYVTPDGVLLGKWIARQRYTWQNPEHSSARVTPERKAQLDELGMVWEKYDPWQERYDLAKKYQEEHGDLNVPLNYKSEDGIWLGSWLYRQRQYLRTGIRGWPTITAKSWKRCSRAKSPPSSIRPAAGARTCGSRTGRITSTQPSSILRNTATCWCPLITSAPTVSGWASGCRTSAPPARPDRIPSK